MNEGEWATTLERAVNRLSPVGQDSLRALADCVRPLRFEVSQWLLRAGTPAEDLFLVVHGLVREYHIDEYGGEHTRSFAADGHFTGSLMDLLSTGQPSVTWAQALEPTLALAIPYQRFERLCEQHVDLLVLARRAVEALYVRKARREYELLSLPAADRYASWLREFPELDSRVSRRTLASYLGITPEHLSRIRRDEATRLPA
jgi:CRP-like cAMP-binding protein